MNSTIYVLKIFEAGADEPSQTFESSQPFSAVNVGDLINTRVWPGHRGNLRVVSIRHSISQLQDGRTVKQEIEVYTQRSPIGDLQDLHDEEGTLLHND